MISSFRLNVSQNVLSVLKALGFEVVESRFGQCVELSAHQAIIFSTVTGASYLDDDFFPFTPKGLTKIFNQALGTTPVWGLFDSGEPGHTIQRICARRPFLVDSPKYVLPLDIADEGEYRQAITTVRNATDNPEQFLVFRVESWKKGSGLEPLLEFAACCVFGQLGYICETQVPLRATVGSPDFLGYVPSSTSNDLSHFTYIHRSGWHMLEFAMMRVFGSQGMAWPKSDLGQMPPLGSLVVGEAKVGGSSPTPQLRKYRETQLFDAWVALLDRQPADPLQELLSIPDETNPLVTISGLKDRNNTEMSQQSNYKSWLEFVTSLYTVSNLTKEEILANKIASRLNNRSSYFDVACHLALNSSFGDLLEYLEIVGVSIA